MVQNAEGEIWMDNEYYIVKVDIGANKNIFLEVMY